MNRYLRILSGVLALARIRRRYVAGFEAQAPLQAVDTGSAVWRLPDGGEAALRLHFPRQRAPVGYCEVVIETCHTEAGWPMRLSPDNGTEFTEQFLVELLAGPDGFARGMMYIPFGTTALNLRLQVSSDAFQVRSATFRMQGFVSNLQVMLGSRPARTVPAVLRPLYWLAKLVLRLCVLLERGLGRGGAYQRFLQKLELGEQDRVAAQQHCQRLQHPAVFSVVIAAPSGGGAELQRAVASLRKQLYPHWRLHLMPRQPGDARQREMLQALVAQDPRIDLSAPNAAVPGEFVLRLGAADQLHELALYYMAAALESHDDADLIYTDHDHVDRRGRRWRPNLKPDWSPDLLWCTDYIGPAVAFRRAVLESLQLLGAALDPARGYACLLAVTAVTPAQRICHIAELLYHVGDPAVAPAAALLSAERELQALRARFPEDTGVRIGPGLLPGSYHVMFPLPPVPPKVSIIVPTRDADAHLKRSVRSVLEQTTYPDFELILVDNQSVNPHTLAFLAQCAADPRVRVLQYDAPFNYSAINNFAARHAHGEVLVLLNDDTEVISAAWLEEMVALAVRADTGAVGAKLYFPDRSVQHGGVALGMGIGAVAGHLHLHAAADASGYLGHLKLRQNLSAVTAACMAVEKRKFFAVGGLDENHLRVAFNDVDLCLRLGTRGWRTVWTPWAELYHYESKTRGSDMAPEHRSRYRAEIATMRQRWARTLAADPYYHPYLSRQRQDYGLSDFPSPVRPWSRIEA